MPKGRSSGYLDGTRQSPLNHKHECQQKSLEISKSIAGAGVFDLLCSPVGSEFVEHGEPICITAFFTESALLNRDLPILFTESFR